MNQALKRVCKEWGSIDERRAVCLEVRKSTNGQTQDNNILTLQENRSEELENEIELLFVPSVIFL